MRSRVLALLGAAGLALASSGPATAALPVVDLASIAKLIQQIQAMQAQLQVAQDTYRATTGARGMDQLLVGTVRNYLPPNWAQVGSLLGQANAQYQALAVNLSSLKDSNAVLDGVAIGRLTPEGQRELDRSRAQVALMQSLSHEALARTSDRFASLQRLIDALPTTNDPKAVMDLQARIGAEQAMLENEQTKLHSLFESLAAERALQSQQRRERAIRDLGRFRDLPPLGL